MKIKKMLLSIGLTIVEIIGIVFIPYNISLWAFPTKEVIIFT